MRRARHLSRGPTRKASGRSHSDESREATSAAPPRRQTVACQTHAYSGIARARYDSSWASRQPTYAKPCGRRKARPQAGWDDSCAYSCSQSLERPQHSMRRTSSGLRCERCWRSPTDTACTPTNHSRRRRTTTVNSGESSRIVSQHASIRDRVEGAEAVAHSASSPRDASPVPREGEPSTRRCCAARLYDISRCSGSIRFRECGRAGLAPSTSPARQIFICIDCDFPHARATAVCELGSVD